jgi:hypothetical protein
MNTEEKRITDHIINLLEEHKKINSENEYVWNGLDIAITIIKEDLKNTESQ